ncbi:hypothetical protein F4801DRAFT_596194 [Xylaria longipes]|nr:hypothetical protein F4801DRAFT_596194 [Xylaria longipes]
MRHMNVQTDRVLWQQLSDINSTLEHLHDRPAVFKILEGLRASTRILLNDRVRSRLRPLRILDLPNELLVRIFEYVKGDTGIDELHFYNFVSRTSNEIRNIRLTCRRFHATSSHLLLPFIKVNITRPSLARLDEVSRHPSISKGVRAIKLSLTPFYDSTIAHDIRAFALYHASKLRESIVHWGNLVDQSLCGETPIEVFQRAITKAVSLAESWEQLVDRGVDTNRADHLIISEAHEQYLQLYEDYEGLSGSLAQAVASAMMRMPTATWIKVDTKLYNLANRYLRPGDLDQTGAILDYLLSSMTWSEPREYGLGPRPSHLIGELLLSTQRLSIPLKGLSIEAPPPPTASLSTSNTATIHDPAVLRAAVEQLETISFHPRPNIWDDDWTGRAPEEFYFTDFLLDLLHTKSLKRIYLNFYFMVTDYPPPKLSMAPLVLSYTWPKLQQLYFNGPFHFKELKAVVKRLGRNVKLQWCGYLMSGSWVDVLDFLREHTASEKRLGDVNGSAAHS